MLLGLLSCNGPKKVLTQPIGVDSADWARWFEEESVQGTFVLYDPGSGRWRFHNRLRADSLFSPASTFKIFNSLTALETGVIDSETEILKWDGIDKGREKWNMDHDLRSAIRYSCVWCYQELARRIGEEQMQIWLYKGNYGNTLIGDSIDQFWLDGSLQISAIEQVQFLYELERQHLPFKKEIQQTVIDIMQLESGEDWQWFGKTGWTRRLGERVIGWHVGFVRSGEEVRIYAMNIDIEQEEDAALRVELTKRILISEGLIRP